MFDLFEKLSLIANFKRLSLIGQSKRGDFDKSVYRGVSMIAQI